MTIFIVTLGIIWFGVLAYEQGKEEGREEARREYEIKEYNRRHPPKLTDYDYDLY